MVHPTCIHGCITDTERKWRVAFKTNYRFQRTERDRLKQAKKEEKLKRRQERDADASPPTSPENPEENKSENE